MARVVLIHWHAEEAEERAGRLRALGHQAVCALPRGNEGLRPFRDQPPDAFVIDLDRLPSQGCAVGQALRQFKATRAVPLVFAGGAPEKVERVRRLLPDAAYTSWGGMGPALEAAQRAPAARPVVPGTMAGYAGTPLIKKLGIKPGAAVTLMDPPADFQRTLGVLPEGARLMSRGAADVILLFADSRARLEARFPRAARRLAPGGALWIVWPKQSSGRAADLTQAAVRRFGLGTGFVDYKICAVDETWSGLCFARRASAAEKSPSDST